MMISYAQGNNDREEVDRLFSLGTILSVGSGIIFLVLLYILREELLNFGEISSHLKNFAGEYYSGLIFWALLQLVNIFLYTIFLLKVYSGRVICSQRDFRYCTFLKYRRLATTFGTLTSIIVQIYYLKTESQLHFKFYRNLKKRGKEFFTAFIIR